ncbi:MAG: xanthine dehydrogenase family protein molybdopterin-binding subunit [Polyangiaceae bacterium]|nr:xanthine dehydrogenase family protein molybdopterin-binding subunit [Polyangiaceae bacterium]
MSRRASRRLFLQATFQIGSGLLIGCVTRTGSEPLGEAGQASTPALAPNAWVRVGIDGAVTVVIDKAELGQGVETSLAMLVAEELDADWTTVRTEFAPASPVYANALYGIQVTAGSTSVRAGFMLLRAAGAAARQMLIAAAADQWGVDPSTCRTESGEVIHDPSGQRLGYGALAEAAAALPVPQDPPLKDPSQFALIGTSPPRLDDAAKLTGRAVFGIDVKLPGMLTAVIVRPPVFGASLVSFDASAAMAVAGVHGVHVVDAGVAVVADHYWAARKGAAALSAQWSWSPCDAVDEEEILAEAAALAAGPGAVAASVGDAEAALGSAAHTIEAIYTAPYQAQATMEPMNSTADVRPDGCDVWTPTQYQEGALAVTEQITGLPASSINIHTTYAGGGFGRRSEFDFVAEAVAVSKAAGAPVKVIWSRQDDIRHTFFRPLSYHALRAGLGGDGKPIAWTHRIVCQSIMSRALPQWVVGGIDPASVEGAVDQLYDIPNLHVDSHILEAPVPVGWWRCVGYSFNSFVLESFIDELAALAGEDPFEYRRDLLSGAPRLKAVLELAAANAGWGTPLGPRKGRGIAAVAGYGSFLAQVAEVTVKPGGVVKLDRVVCVIDCGQVVDPDTVRAQMVGGIVFGVTATLKSKITIQQGKALESNFHNFKLLGAHEMPAVDVIVVPSSAPPGGVGQVGTTAIPAAIANAVFAATGKRVRKLPIRPCDL